MSELGRSLAGAPEALAGSRGGGLPPSGSLADAAGDPSAQEQESLDTLDTPALILGSPGSGKRWAYAWALADHLWRCTPWERARHYPSILLSLGPPPAEALEEEPFAFPTTLREEVLRALALGSLPECEPFATLPEWAGRLEWREEAPEEGPVLGALWLTRLSDSEVFQDCLGRARPLGEASLEELEVVEAFLERNRVFLAAAWAARAPRGGAYSPEAFDFFSLSLETLRAVEASPLWEAVATLLEERRTAAHG